MIESEAFFTRPQHEYARILDFLGLPLFEPDQFDRWNVRPRAPMEPATRRWLSDYFSSHDEALTRLLGHAPEWTRD